MEDFEGEIVVFLFYFLSAVTESNQRTPQKEREVAIPPFPLDSYPTQTPTLASFITVRTDILLPH